MKLWLVDLVSLGRMCPAQATNILHRDPWTYVELCGTSLFVLGLAQRFLDQDIFLPHFYFGQNLRLGNWVCIRISLQSNLNISQRLEVFKTVFRANCAFFSLQINPDLSIKDTLFRPLLGILCGNLGVKVAEPGNWTLILIAAVDRTSR